MALQLPSLRTFHISPARALGARLCTGLAAFMAVFLVVLISTSTMPWFAFCVFGLLSWAPALIGAFLLNRGNRLVVDTETERVVCGGKSWLFSVFNAVWLGEGTLTMDRVSRSGFKIGTMSGTAWSVLLAFNEGQEGEDEEHALLAFVSTSYETSRDSAEALAALLSVPLRDDTPA